MLPHLIFLAAAASISTATNLHVSSYSGLITSFSLTKHQNGTYDLKTVGTTNFSAPSPSWLTLDRQSRILYSIDEGINTLNGSLSSYHTSPSGKLTPISRLPTINGGVSSVIFDINRHKKAIAIAHYEGSAFSTFSITRNGSMAPLQNFTFSIPSPGPVTDRQEAPHPHQVIVDPTGEYLLVPDLGADLIRVYRNKPNADSGKLVEQESLKMLPGYGPRHAVFWSPYSRYGNSTIYLYVVHELNNEIVGFAVRYLDKGGLALEEVYKTNSFGGGKFPIGAAVSEISILPSPPTLLLSNRNDSTFSIPSNNPTTSNHTPTPSDSLSTFNLHTNGSFSFIELLPAGGYMPRSIMINKRGNLVAVGLQRPNRVVVLERYRIWGGGWKWKGEVARGEIKAPVGRERGKGGEVTCVVWDE
ncbi:MAG: hypothetical protein M1812_005449 [Candelaria pacifica]|nr:MAG: hypothetical protein M1812_005449 [Candelaria pacifica]